MDMAMKIRKGFTRVGMPESRFLAATQPSAERRCATRLRFRVLPCALVAVMMAAGCATTKAPTPKAAVPPGYESIRMVGASLGGSYTTTVTAFSALFNRYYPEIEWSACSGASGTSPVYLTKGSIKLAITSPSNYITAYGFDKIPESRLRSINQPTMPLQNVFLIPEDKPWKDITQLPKGATVCPGSPGSATLTDCEVWLKVCGLSKSDFNWVPMGRGEMGDAWRSGKLDAGFAGIAGMAPFLLDMHTGPRKIKAMGMSPEQAARAKAEQAFERIGDESPSMSNLSEIAGEIFKFDVLCPKQPSFLNCRDDFPEDIAYKMARVIDQQNAELTQIYAPLKAATPQMHIDWAKPPYAIHSGVAKYYREKGYLK